MILSPNHASALRERLPFVYVFFPGVELSVSDKEDWNLRRDGEHYTKKQERRRLRTQARRL